LYEGGAAEIGIGKREITSRKQGVTWKGEPSRVINKTKKQRRGNEESKGKKRNQNPKGFVLVGQHGNKKIPKEKSLCP